MQLNDLALTPDGTIYATDSSGGSLFRKKPDNKALTLFGAASALPGANGITLAPDGKLFVAIATGIATGDTASGEPQRLSQPDNIVTGGCDGLYWYDGDLIGIQNGTNPARVIRIELADNGTRISPAIVASSRLRRTHHWRARSRRPASDCQLVCRPLPTRRHNQGPRRPERHRHYRRPAEIGWPITLCQIHWLLEERSCLWCDRSPLVRELWLPRRAGRFG